MGQAKQSTPEVSSEAAGTASGETQEQSPPDPSGASTAEKPTSSLDEEEKATGTSVVTTLETKPPGTRKEDPPPSEQESQTTTTTPKETQPASASSTEDMDGNDQVTKEKPKEPLSAQIEAPSPSSSQHVQPQEDPTQQPASTSGSTEEPQNQAQPTPQPKTDSSNEADESEAPPEPSAVPAVQASAHSNDAHAVDGSAEQEMAPPAGPSHPPPSAAEHPPPSSYPEQPDDLAQQAQQVVQQQQQQQQHSTLIDHRSLYEEQISQQRSVLVERYAPYIEHSDRSLKDARTRLETALGQIRHLRSAFTERVYGKYRVCLRPAESLQETLHGIKTNPVAACRRLEKHIRHIKEEKDLEKKEAQTLNQEISKMDASQLNVNADNADQLMYISAGLSLVILPEDNVDPTVLKGYQDRAPMDQATGQRVRSISQAAAAAGQVMIERTRKAREIRQQWLQQGKTASTAHSRDFRQDLFPSENRTPLDLLTSPSTTSFMGQSEAATKGGLDTNAAYGGTQPSSIQTTNVPRTSALKSPAQPLEFVGSPTTSSQETKGQKKVGKTPISIKAPEPSTAKFGRSRGGAGISVHVSLSLNPTADEITEQPSRASTAALLARGVGTAQGISKASPQQRLRHPHPTSAGGRQRASSATSARKELAHLTQAPSSSGSASPQSYFHLALPPLPTPLERREGKSFPALDIHRSSSARAKRAIASVLSNLNRATSSDGSSRPLNRIELLLDIQRSRKASPKNGAVESPKERPIDPTLAFSVMEAIGLVSDTAHSESSSLVFLDGKVKKLSGGGGKKRKLESLDQLTTKWEKLAPSKRARFSYAFLRRNQKPAIQKPPTQGATGTRLTSPPVENIRGGGEMTSENNDASSGTGVGQPIHDANSRKNNQRSGNAVYGNHVGNHVDNRMMANSMAQNARQAQSRWEGQSLGMMNSHLAANSVPLGMNHNQGSVNPAVAQNQQAAAANDQYQAQNNYALHLAHQLRNATNNMAGLSHQGHPHSHGEVPVANFMNNLHQSGQWSSIGNSAAAMAAAQSSLAALGLSVPMGVYNNVQDRSSRAMIAREQQNVAAAHAVAAHQQSMATSPGFAGGAANPGFQPTTNQTIQQRANAHAALLNSAAQSFGVVNQSQGVGPIPQQQRSSVMPASQGYARAAQESRNSEPTQQARVSVPAQRNKRRAEDSINMMPQGDQGRATMPTALNQAQVKRPRQSNPIKAAIPRGAPHQSAAKMPPSSVATGQPSAIRAQGSQKGMRFFAPNAPAALSSEQVQLVRTGLMHKVGGAASPGSQPQMASEILDYLVAVGTAVPIPKALVASSLKDRLNNPSFKSLASTAGFVMPREAVVAAILVWLWNYHEDDFQRAFAKSGRIDVDPTCKWLVHTAVDTSVRALTQYITESEMTAGVPRSSQVDSRGRSESPAEDSEFSLGFASACVVSKTLTTKSCKDCATDSTLPQFHDFTRFLDECRLVALHSRSQERVLLASLISLKSVMSESFAHAYVSSIVRAGDALGHEALADIVADEDLKISSMLPYDILRDESGNWEDPCRPIEGFSPNLTGDVLTKVAHARAIIQKSLRRLQDRHSIKAGTPTFGAYADLANGQTNSQASGSSTFGSASKSVNGVGTPKSWNKRRVSSSSEGPVPPGTGSAQATTWALYDPKHFSAPLHWNSGAPENTPYGRHRGGAPASLQGLGLGLRKSKKAPAQVNGAKASQFGRSTHEIDWAAVADSFEGVKLPGASSASSPHAAKAVAPAPSFKTIISPFCRQLVDSPVPSDEESDTEEDLSDDAVMARHQIVLDGMKEKLTAFMEARKKMQERRKKSQKSNS